MLYNTASLCTNDQIADALNMFFVSLFTDKCSFPDSFLNIIWCKKIDNEIYRVKCVPTIAKRPDSLAHFILKKCVETIPKSIKLFFKNILK